MHSPALHHVSDELTTGAQPGDPTGPLTFDRLSALVASGRIDTVLLAVTDMQGRLKGKRYHARHFIDRVAVDGAEMCAYVLATDIDMTPVDGFDLTSWSTGYGDLRVRPDLSAMRELPWMPGTALVHADVLHHDGRPVEAAPARVLERELDLLADRGLHVKSGLESEFFLYRGTYEQAADTGYRNLRPAAPHNLDYALDHHPVLDRFLRRLQRSLAGAGLPTEALKTEGAPGQVEITFPYGEPRAACRGHAVMKHAVRHLATEAGMAATFMAAPATGLASGLHIHFSLWDEDQEPLLGAGDTHPSELGLHAIAGLLAGLPVLAPLYAPTTNSYKRFVPNSFAPDRFTWGIDNRTCAIRVIGHGDGLHFEIRLPGADANPCLALAAALAAARHGIDNKLEPPPPCTGNAYEATGATDATRVPATLEAALATLADHPLAQELLTPEVVRHYAHAAEVELAAHRHAVTDIELHRGFDRA